MIGADGEHSPDEIPKLVESILQGRADLVLGRRDKIPRISERIISWLVRLKTGITDSGSGFRAIKRPLALKLKLNGKCICEVSILEAKYLRAKFLEIPVTISSIRKKREIAWGHFCQLFYVLKWLPR